MRRARSNSGSVVFDRRRETWHYLTCENGKRRSQLIGPKSAYPTKASAWQKALTFTPAPTTASPTMRELVTRFEAERFPQRHSTSETYRSWLKNHIVPTWGDQSLSAIQPQKVELWLRGLGLSPKSKTHIRALMYALFEFAMFAGVLELGRNPISLVRNTGASRKVREVRSLTIAEFHSLLNHLPEPFGTLALCCASLGLRISEALGLRWADINWLGSEITIRRSVVAQVVDSPKTQESGKTLSLASELLERLRTWKQCTQFPADDDWVFGSPVSIGRRPFSYTGVRQTLERAANAAGIGKFGTHTFRHSFRTWLGASGVPVELQKELMRHSTITMTLKYGETFDPAVKAASSKVAEMIFPRPN
jgi:integrase